MSYVTKETVRLGNRIVEMNENPKQAERELKQFYSLNASKLCEVGTLVLKGMDEGLTVGEMLEILLDPEKGEAFYESLTTKLSARQTKRLAKLVNELDLD